MSYSSFKQILRKQLEKYAYIRGYVKVEDDPLMIEEEQRTCWRPPEKTMRLNRACIFYIYVACFFLYLSCFSFPIFIYKLKWNKKYYVNFHSSSMLFLLLFHEEVSVKCRFESYFKCAHLGLS